MHNPPYYGFRYVFNPLRPRFDIPILYIKSVYKEAAK